MQKGTPSTINIKMRENNNIYAHGSTGHILGTVTRFTRKLTNQWGRGSPATTSLNNLRRKVQSSLTYFTNIQLISKFTSNEALNAKS
jgi:hypothetical protein